MALLADFERFLERLFERSSARVFHPRLQPVQLERRIERAMELGRVVERDRTRVPERLRVRMHPSDLRAMADDGLDALAGRLADSALRAARARGYHLADRPSVSLVADPSVRPGEAEVDARFGGQPMPTTPAPSPSRGAIPGWGGPPSMATAATADGAALGSRDDPEADAASEPGREPEPEAIASARASAPAVAAAASFPEPLATPPLAPPAASGGAQVPPFEPGADEEVDPTRTLVFRRPIVDAPKAILREIRPDGAERAITVDGAVLTIGRGSDNGLVLDDGRVSRHHGRLQAKRGTLVYTDTGSTNGSRVNGLRVDEIVLGPGDRLQLGDTVLVVETLPG